MKKVKKVLVDKVADVGVAPVWFVSAMERVEHKIEHVVPTWFVSAMEKVATKHDVQNVVPAWFESAMKRIEHKIAEAVAPLATKVEMKKEVSFLARKDEMASSFHTIMDMLDECAKKDDIRKMEARLDRNMKTLNNHETRIIHLEENFPQVSLGISR